jgi:NAD(P)H-flavin reductase
MPETNPATETLNVGGQGSPFVPEEAEILSVETLTAMEKLFRFRIASGRRLSHAPGQFVEVSVYGFGEAPISISSPPTQPDTFELCVRKVGTVTGALHNLKAGDRVGIRGPMGRGFDVEEMAGNDLLFVAGGLGMAPLRSLVKTVMDLRSRFGKVWILYGAKTPQELLFTNEFDGWKKQPNVEMLVTVDRPDEQWRGVSGVITVLFRKLPKMDPKRTYVTVVGPPVMYKFVLLETLSMKIPRNRIFCSLERHMKCGVGRCGHCQINNVYVCKEGPVFRFSQMESLPESFA